MKKHRKINFKSVTDKLNHLNKVMLKEYVKDHEGNDEIENHESRLDKFEKIDNISRNNSASSSVDSMDLVNL